MIIKNHINFDILVPFLNKYRIFTGDEIKYFNESNTESKKVSNLILWIAKKNENGIRNFVKALHEAHEHSGHITILEDLHETAFPHTTV